MLGSERGGQLGTFEFSPYAAGRKIYGAVGSSPTMGPVDKTGYAARDKKLAARRNAVLQKMQGMNKGAYSSPDVLRFMR
jgi:hypothetical protein